MTAIPRTFEELIKDLEKEVKFLKRRMKVDEKQSSSILSAHTIIDILAEMGWDWRLGTTGITKNVSVQIQFWNKDYSQIDIHEDGHRNFAAATLAMVENEKFKKWLSEVIQ